MQNSSAAAETAECFKSLFATLFGSQRLISKAASQYAAGLAALHPFVGSLPVSGGGKNENFRLTGVIIESITVNEQSPTSAAITLNIKDPDSYHKDIFLDGALDMAAPKIEEELGAILSECGF